MEFVKNFTPSDFQEKIFTPSISPNFNSFSGKKHKKCVKMEKFTPLAKVLHLTEWLFLPKICQSSFSFGKRLFVLEWLVSGSRQEMVKSTFGLALSAQLIDLPLHRQFVRQVKVYLCTISQRPQMEKLNFCKIKDDPKILSGVLGVNKMRDKVPKF